MIKSIEQLSSLEGKKVLVRVDYNVPFSTVDGKVEVKDPFRIQQSYKTLKYRLGKGAKVIIFSHLGKVNHKDPTQTESDKKKNDMQFVYHYLDKDFSYPVSYVDATVGPKVVEAIAKLKGGEALLLQNTRYEKGEEKNNPELAKFYADLVDIYVMDAFGSAHRAHASTYGVPELLKQAGKEVAIGYLVEKEVAALSRVVSPDAHPYIAILGGAKVSDKIKVIEQLLKKTDQILIGGAMAYTFLKALGHQIGSSLVENEQLEYAKKCYESGKILLPIDHVVATDIKATAGQVTPGVDIVEGSGFDVGPKTIALFDQAIKSAKIVFVNGPVGVFENPAFEKGTKAIFQSLVQNKEAFIVIGGGDSASAAKKFGYDKGQFAHISTGGGASLEIIENDGHLPGIDILDK